MPTCPACHSRGPHRRIARSEYPSTTPAFIGGPLFAMAVDLSKRRAFRCGACGQTFLSHTFSSGLSLGVLLLVVCLPVAVWLLRLLVYVLHH